MLKIEESLSKRGKEEEAFRFSKLKWLSLAEMASVFSITDLEDTEKRTGVCNN